MKKFTSLMLMLTLFVSTAMADFTISYKKQTSFWGSAVGTYPEEINTVVSDNSLTIGSVYCVEKGVNVTEAGDITVTIAHVDGNHRQHILGVALKDAEGTIVYKDFHYGENPGDNNTYTLTGVAAGKYTACFYVCDMGTDQANHYGGTITAVGNIDLITPAMNLSLGVSGNGRRFDSAKGVYEWNSGCWAVEANVPDGVINGGLQNNLEAANVHSAKQAVVIENAGTITVFFKYAGGSNRLDILGADILKDGNVVASDYHFGYTGNAAENNMYVFNVAEAGEYELRFLVSNKQEALTSNGKITVCLISKYIDFDGAYRLNSTVFADQNLCLDVTQYNATEKLKLQEKQEYDKEQLFVIEYTGENPYYTMRTITGKNVALSGGWDATASGAAAMSFDITEKAEGIYNIWTEKGFFGCNKTTGYQNVTAENANGAPMYTNHSADNDNLGWAFEEATDIYGFEDLQSGCAYYFQVAKSFDFMHYNAEAADVLSFTSFDNINENSVFVYYVSPNTNAKFLFNVAAQKFIGTTSTANAKMPLSETPNPVNLKTANFSTSPIMISTNGTNALNFNAVLGGFINWNGGFAYNNDKGNAFSAYDAPLADEEILATIAELVDAYETPAKKAELQTLIDAAKAYTFGTKVGQYTQAAIEETLAAAIDAAEVAYNNATTATQAIEATNTLQNVIDNLAIVLPSADKFYKIVKYDDATKVVYIENNDLKGNWGENTTPASVWAFEQGATDGKFYLRNVGTGSYINGYAKNNTIYGGDKKDETSVILYDASKRQVGIAPNDGEHFNRASGRLCAWTDYFADSNSAWLIEEVTEFAHTLTVGAAGYTTLVLGYNATVPAIEGEGNGVFTATVNGEWIDLTAVEAGSVLPANTAVIIKAAADTELSFAYSAEQAAEVTTDLSGTLYDKNVAPGEGNTAYILSKQNGVVGFYKAALNQVENTAFKNNANKAYLVVEGAELAAYSFRFPGTTGIEEVTTENGNVKAIYDLTGRRVEAITAPGIYIVNGVKRVVR